MSDRPVVLAISGLDPSGGAGLLLDARVLGEHDVYPAGVATALTDQDSNAVYSIGTVPPAVVEQQIRRVLADLPVAAIKIGMLGKAPIADAVARALEGTRISVVLDPILKSSGGSLRLLDEPTALDPLLRRARIVTPNTDEAAALGGPTALFARGVQALLIKGGDRPGELVIDRFLDGKHVVETAAPRIAGGPVHGTGCALSSSIAAHLSRGTTLADAVALAQAYVRGKIQESQRLGHGQRLIF